MTGEVSTPSEPLKFVAFMERDLFDGSATLSEGSELQLPFGMHVETLRPLAQVMSEFRPVDGISTRVSGSVFAYSLDMDGYMLQAGPLICWIHTGRVKALGIPSVKKPEIGANIEVTGQLYVMPPYEAESVRRTFPVDAMSDASRVVKRWKVSSISHIDYRDVFTVLLM